ncbi:MAG: hypothetical protein IKQ49_03345 [Eubacterium sp.]|nr:hypothetical protein [Eubacterium sp.]
MKKIRRRLLTAALAVVFGGMTVSSSGEYRVEAAQSREGWHKSAQGWWYALSDGGYISDGWKKLDGKWYFFNTEGYMAASEWVQGYWLGKNGSWTYQPRGSWHKSSKGWWYGDTSGWYAKSGTWRIDGKGYPFDEKGLLVEEEYGKGTTNLSDSVTKKDIPETKMTAAHENALSESGVMLLDKTVELGEDGNANYLISPISLQLALGMAAAGSDPGSNTRKELMSLLLPGLSEEPQVMNQEMASFTKRMKEAKGVSWNVANSVWVRNNANMKLRDSYISDVTNYYLAELYSAPFDQTTVEAINAWVKKNTRDRIPKIIDRLGDQSMAALINAMAFDGDWMVPYEDEAILKDQEFTNADGTKRKAVMLKSREYGAISLAGGIGFSKPYKGNEYSFVAILPPEGMTTGEYLSEIRSGSTSFAEAFRNRDYSRPLQVTFPEFKTAYGNTMNDVLKGLGIREAFTDEAHFRSMVADDCDSLKISTVAHRAMIEVDREGTKAAAATAVVYDKASAFEPETPLEIRVDRPFLYAIVDTATGVPVFLGVENTLNAE